MDEEFTPERESTNSVCKGQMEAILGSPDHKVSDTATQFCHHRVKAAAGNSKRMAVGGRSNKALFTKQVAGPLCQPLL